MRVSYIINTACRDPWACGSGNIYRSAGYSQRYDLLTQKVLPAALAGGFDEIIVAGVFEDGAWYRYVNVPPRCRDRRDALLQREIGARYATGDILVFGHDDHAVGAGFAQTLRRLAEDASWDLLIPKRIHGITGAELNNGKDANYVGSHVLVMRRWLWAEVPWTTLDSEYWDVSMTRLWLDTGARLLYSDSLIHYDVEAQAGET